MQVNDRIPMHGIYIKSYVPECPGNPFVRERQFTRSPVTGSASKRFEEKVFLSPVARQAGALYRALAAIEDPTRRELAVTGLACIVSMAVNDPARAQLLRFMRLMAEMQRNDEGHLQQVFEIAGRLGAGNHGLEAWIAVFLEIDNGRLLRVFVEETGDIIRDEEADTGCARASFDFFLFMWRERKRLGRVADRSESRIYHRKKIRLAGWCQNLHTLERCDIAVTDLSPVGLGFEVLGASIPRLNDLIRIFFVIDAYTRKEISKLAKVKRRQGVFVGTQFRSRFNGV